MNTHVVSALAWERMVTAVEMVRQRLRRATQALEQAGIPYVVADDHAVAAWVGEVDEAAVRNTQDVDILLRRSDFERAKQALVGAGFVYRHSSGIDMFLDPPGTKARNAVHIVFAGEKVRETYDYAAPDVVEAKVTATFHVLDLEALLRMKLTSFRRKDQVHVLDLIEVGLVDETWSNRLPEELRGRLQQLLENPDG
ncbi:MAG: hypothetical protein WD648_00560 [Planctomycetaceae bacterium]